MVLQIISIYRASIDIFFITVLKRKVKSNNVKETAKKKNMETTKQIKTEEYSSPNTSELWDRVQSGTTRSVLRERNTASIPYENVMPGKLNIFSILTCNSPQT